MVEKICCMIFLPFRPITCGRLRRSRYVFWSIVLVAAVIYTLTACRYAAPGLSAQWIAWLSGMDVREAPSHSLLLGLTSIIKHLPILELPWRLNLLAALTGALVCGLVYNLVWSMIFEVMREESAVHHASRMAVFGGVLAACTVGLSLPVWQAATHFQPDIFDLALLLFLVQLLLWYARSQRGVFLFWFALLYGLGVVETPLLITVVPLLWGALILIKLKHDWTKPYAFLLTVGMTLAVSALWSVLNAWHFAHVSGLPSERVTLLNIIVTVWHDQFLWLRGCFYTGSMWLINLVLGIGGALITIFAMLYAIDNRRSWSLLVLQFFMSLVAVALLLNLSFAPWAFAAVQGRMAAATYLFTGIAMALLVTNWRALTLMQVPEQTDKDQLDWDMRGAWSNHYLVVLSSNSALIIWPILMGLVVIGTIFNVIRIQTDDGSFVDRAACEILDNLGEKEFLFTNGLLDANLIIQAHARGYVTTGSRFKTSTAKRKITLISPHRSKQQYYLAALQRDVQQSDFLSEGRQRRLMQLLELHLHHMIDDLFLADDYMVQHGVTMGMADLWYNKNSMPLSTGLVVGGVPNIQTLDVVKLLHEHQDFWNRWQKFVQTKPKWSYQLSAQSRTLLQRYLSLLINNLGVSLLDCDMVAEADMVFEHALESSPENISALLNRFALTRAGYHPEQKERLELALQSIVAQGTTRYPLWSLNRYYGYVRDPEMFTRLGWQWALSSAPRSILAVLRDTSVSQLDAQEAGITGALLAALYAMEGDALQSRAICQQILERDPRNTQAISGLTRLALREGKVEEARAYLEEGNRAGAMERELRIDWAAMQLVAGDLPRARIMLEELCDGPDATLTAMSMLALVMIQQGEARQVEHTLIPRMQRAAGAGRESYLVHIIRGKLLQTKGNTDNLLMAARTYYLQASYIRPDILGLQELILRLDAALRDQKGAEARALILLQRDRQNALANYILGSLRLAQGYYAEAVDHLRWSVLEENASLGALNNYAEALLWHNQLDEAQDFARRAVTQFPQRYEGWSTLASILLEKRDVSAARHSLNEAHKLHDPDIHLELQEALVSLQEGNLEQAKRCYRHVQNQLKNPSPAQQELMLRLRRGLAEDSSAL